MNALHDRVEDLFRSCPVLCGFSVDSEMFVSNLSCYPALDAERTATLRDEIAAALSDLLDDEPQAAELIRNRTFARALH